MVAEKHILPRSMGNHTILNRGEYIYYIFRELCVFRVASIVYRKLVFARELLDIMSSLHTHTHTHTFLAGLGLREERQWLKSAELLRSEIHWWLLRGSYTGGPGTRYLNFNSSMTYGLFARCGL